MQGTRPAAVARAAPKRDYYEILGVERGASTDDIKHAFRLKAVKLHPDQNPSNDAKRRFAELREAYGVLADDMRRRFYDANGMTEIEFSRARTEEALDDLFWQEPAQPTSPAPSSRRQRAGTVLVVVDAAAIGSGPETATLRYPRLVLCSGCSRGARPAECRECSGTGRCTVRRGLRAATVRCPGCHGSGNVAPADCPACSGQGRLVRMTRLPLAPARSGESLRRVEAAGDEVPGDDPGDLLIWLVGGDRAEARSPLDIHTELELGFAAAALGGERVLSTPRGQQRLLLPRGVRDGQELRFDGLGHTTADGRRGALVVTVRVGPPPADGPARSLLEQLGKFDEPPTSPALPRR